MTRHITGAAISGLVILASSCSRGGDEQARREALEQRVARLEAGVGEPAGGTATGARGASPSAAGSRTDSGSPGAATAPAAGATLTLEERIDALEKQMARTLKTTRAPLVVDKTGNEVCAESGKVCLTIIDAAGSARYDVNDRFCGHMVADCNARVSKRLRCGGTNDYVLSPVKFYRSPGTRAQCDTFETETCESSPSDITAICLD